MATRTASVSGLWSDTLTWGSNPVPVAGDAVVINAGVVVTFDVDQSGFASGLIASTINGTLQVSQNAGTYYWKCAATVTWGAAASYLVNGGTLGTPLPANVTFTQEATGNITLNAFNAGTVVDIWCQEPANRYIRLSGAEAAGQTALSVDTDVSGESLYWKNGNLIDICDVNGNDAEGRTISGTPSATEVTVTAGLTNAKIIGALLVLVTRNVKIIGAGNGTLCSGSPTNEGQARINAEIRNFANLQGNNVSRREYGGALSNITSQVLGSGSACKFSGTVSRCPALLNTSTGSIIENAVIAGCSNGFTTARGVLVKDTLITGCANGSTVGGDEHYYHCEISGNTIGIDSCNGLLLVDCLLENNVNADVTTPKNGKAYNTQFNSTNEFTGDTSVARPVDMYFESINHDDTAGNYLALTQGGRTTTVAPPSEAYPGQPRAYLHSPVSTSVPAYMVTDVLVPPGETLTVTCYARKDASMSYLPRLWVFSADKQPLVSGSPDVEDIMTDSVDTWETLEAEVTNSANYPVTYRVMTLAKNASGSVYVDPVIAVSGGSGSGISRGRLVNAA